jgi:hypothetical protein
MGPIQLLTRLAISASLAILLTIGGATAAGAHPLAAGTRSVALASNVRVSGPGKRARRKRSLRRRAQGTAGKETSGLLFDGSHIGDFNQLQEAPGAITEVPDPAGSGETDFAMTVSDQDVYPLTPTDNPRAQALSPPLIEQGDEFWLQTKFMLPENLPTVKGWMSLMQIYGAPFNGSSPWEIDVAENEILWQRNGTYDWDIPWRMPLVKGRWISVLLHERFAGDGWVEMWIDGQQVSFFESDTRLAMQTMDSSNDGGPNAAKIMQYREAGMFASASVYFGPLKLGTTRASVSG